MLHFHAAPYLYFGRLDRFVCLRKVHVHPSIHSWTHFVLFAHSLIHKQIFAWPSIHNHIPFHASFFISLENMSFCMCSPCSSHLSSRHVCLCTCICSHSWRDDIKSKNLLFYHDAWSFRMQVNERGDKVLSWDGGFGNYWWKLRMIHWAMNMGTPDWQWLSVGSGSVGGQNSVVFGRNNSGWGEVQQAKSTQFPEWVGSRSLAEKQHNCWGELAVSCWVTSSNNCTIPEGN